MIKRSVFKSIIAIVVTLCMVIPAVVWAEPETSAPEYVQTFTSNADFTAAAQMEKSATRLRQGQHWEK